jgi:hypothetical protein
VNVKLFENNLLSLKEIEILEDYNKGISKENISKKYNIPINELDVYIEQLIDKRNKLKEYSKDLKTTVRLREIDSRVGIEQIGYMKVGSKIVRYLSEGIYNSPAGTLKELISNSFDADAEKVEITTTNDSLVVYDNGEGMDWETFDEDFTFIAVSIKRRQERISKIYKRPIIGFLGIGFISVSELCDTLKITSCKKNSDLLFEAEIDFSKYRDIESEEKEFYEISEYKIINYKKKEKNINFNESFTKMELKNLRSGFKSILQDLKPFNSNQITIHEILNYLSTSFNTGITNLGRYWQMVLELAMIIPVQYLPDGPVHNYSNNTIESIEKSLKEFNFKVYFNGVELFKPFNFPLVQKNYTVHTLNERIETTDGNLSFIGYIYNQHGIIDPKEFIGLLIRIKNVAIGRIDRALLGYPSGSAQLFRNWIFGEIYITEGLENAMNINRNAFKDTDSQYLALRNRIHEILSETVFKYSLENFYRAGRELRQEEREKENQQNINNIIINELGPSYKFYWKDISSKEIIHLDHKNKELIINYMSPIITKLSIKDQYVLEKIMVLLELSIYESKGDLIKMKKIFLDKLEAYIK